MDLSQKLVCKQMAQPLGEKSGTKNTINYARRVGVSEVCIAGYRSLFSQKSDLSKQVGLFI